MLIAIDSDNFNHIPNECMRCGLREEDRWCYASPSNHSLEPIPLKGRAEWCPLKEIVRCKDCKYAHLTSDGRFVKYCDNITDEEDFPIELYENPNHFCSDGERKDNND